MMCSNSEKSLPLQGIKILDLTRLLPGPLCTMVMGDYGAEVIKIEDIDAGDPTRFVGRFFEGSGSFFRQLNRNKKSLAVNLKTEEGRKVIEKLTEETDVIIEGFRPGVMDRLGLGYGALKPRNRKLIYASLSGYGQEGPYRLRAGHDINYTALTGLLDLSAEQDGSPQMPAIQVADIAGGAMMAVNGIMFALFQRERNGKGSFVDISMTRGLLPWLSPAAAALNSSDHSARKGGGPITGAYACYNIYETADGKHMSLGALEPVFWHKFCEAVGRPQWSALQYEQKGRKKLIRDVQALFKEKTRDQWETLLANSDVCCEPVLSLEEAIEHPLGREGFYWIRTKNTEGETEIMPGFPLLFSGQTGEIRLQPPRHGEHTGEILQSIGYTQVEINELFAHGVIKL